MNCNDSEQSLREHQRAMRDLIRGNAIADDPYIVAASQYIVAASQSVGLEVTRDTIAGWRKLRLDRNCRLTTAILRQRGLYDDVFASLESESPFVEELSNAFLEAAIATGDALVATVARFEQAILRDDDVERWIDWPCNPYDVLSALLTGDEIPPLVSAPHRTVVCRSIEGMFRVTARR